MGDLPNAYEALTSLDEKARTLPQALLIEGKIELDAGEPTKALKAFSAIEFPPEASSFNSLVSILGKIDASLALNQTSKALTFLLDLLSSGTNPSLLKSLSARFDQIITTAPQTDKSDHPAH